mmetsp:Transcript_4354/g.7346  ORF Transcript_4354/g.7346 Transcript_4354/m.7346 type:complete len:135 (+) Transcript_4354:103-507(+)
MTDRHCTDVICCLLFSVFIVAMVGLSVYAFQTGDPVKLFTPYDSDGNQCGFNNGTNDLTEYPYKFFPSLFNAAVSGDTKYLYEAVCVKKCPLKDEETECLTNEEFSSCPDADYETTQLITYCVPEYDSTSEAIE